MLGAYKKHPQAYLLYVEDCFLLSDNADTHMFSKGVLDVEFKEYDIPILHNVFLAFLTIAAGFFDFLFRAVFKEVVKTVDFCFDESSLKVGVDNAGRLGCGISGMDCPCAAFVFSGSKKGTQSN